MMMKMKGRGADVMKVCTVSTGFLVMAMIISTIVSPPWLGPLGFVKGLRMDYYLTTCPLADRIVTNTVNNALHADPTLAGALLRMHFHDCWIEGCDGSVLIDSTKDNKAEKESPGNLSLRGFEVIDDAKQEIEEWCPGVVSCADIIAMAARDAIVFSGGPVYDIPKGRKDGRRSKFKDNRTRLPLPTFNGSELVSTFSHRGFTLQDMVALSGAHTLGVARCSSFKSRLRDGADSTLNSNFKKTLARTCRAGDNAEQVLDVTRNTFDNLYFIALQRRNGVLFSDETLYASPQTRGMVNAYAINMPRFFFDFQQAMVKLGRLDVKEGSQGEVRMDCRRIN